MKTRKNKPHNGFFAARIMKAAGYSFAPDAMNAASALGATDDVDDDTLGALLFSFAARPAPRLLS